MGTKLKSITHSRLTKLFCILIIPVLLVSMVMTYMSFEYQHQQSMQTLKGVHFTLTDYFYSSAMETPTFLNYARYQIVIMEQLVRKGTREDIEAGKYVTEDALESEYWKLFHSLPYEKRNIEYTIPGSGTATREITREEVEARYADKINALPARIIADQLRDLNSLERDVKSDIYLYYISNGKSVYTNCDLNRDGFVENGFYFLSDTGSKETDVPLWSQRLTGFLPESANAYSIYFAVEKGFAETLDFQFHLEKSLFSESISRMLFAFIGVILAAVILAFGLCRKRGTEGLRVTWIDRLWAEPAAAAFIFTGYLLLLGIDRLTWSLTLYDLFSGYNPVSYWLVTLFLLLPGLFVTLFYIFIVKSIKSRRIFKNYLVYKLCATLGKFIANLGKNVNRMLPPFLKLAGLFVGLCLLTLVQIVLFLRMFYYSSFSWMLLFIWFPALPIIILVSYHISKQYTAIRAGAQKMREGDFSGEIKVTGREFTGFADDINHIQEGLSTAIANELKSERMKNELVTNVSHDIRTPLTSIISYADLLSDPDLPPEKAAEYVEIIKAKSAKLKSLTESLFDISKAASQNLDITLTSLSLNQLVSQSLGEFESEFEKNGLEVRVNVEHVNIMADSSLMWRVLENLLGNIVKYAAPDSRVYIDSRCEEGFALLTFKNMSAQELNIDPAELLERFKQGDNSRNAEGNGLGLSIADGFIAAQKGRFHVEIDGDLFKAVVAVPLAQPLIQPAF